VSRTLSNGEKFAIQGKWGTESGRQCRKIRYSEWERRRGRAPMPKNSAFRGGTPPRAGSNAEKFGIQRGNATAGGLECRKIRHSEGERRSGRAPMPKNSAFRGGTPPQRAPMPKNSAFRGGTPPQAGSNAEKFGIQRESAAAGGLQCRKIRHSEGERRRGRAPMPKNSAFRGGTPPQAGSNAEKFGIRRGSPPAKATARPPNRNQPADEYVGQAVRVWLVQSPGLARSVFGSTRSKFAPTRSSKY